MGNQTVTQAVLVPGTVPNVNQGSMQLAIYHEDGSPFQPLYAITPADGMDDSTATEIEGLVADFNELLAHLRSAGFVANLPF